MALSRRSPTRTRRARSTPHPGTHSSSTSGLPGRCARTTRLRVKVASNEYRVHLSRAMSDPDVVYLLPWRHQSATSMSGDGVNVQGAIRHTHRVGHLKDGIEESDKLARIRAVSVLVVSLVSGTTRRQHNRFPTCLLLPAAAAGVSSGCCRHHTTTTPSPICSALVFFCCCSSCCPHLRCNS